MPSRPLLPVLALFVLVLFATVPTATADAVPVETGLLGINFGNHDANKGTYVIDFYLVLRWDTAAAPEDFSPEKFEFMNGRATARERIADETDPDTNLRTVWYRIQASLYSEPRFTDYPFDTQTLQILFEDSVHDTSKLVYVPMEGFSGIDESFRVAGWSAGEPLFQVSDKAYGFGETYSRASFSVELTRERFSTGLKMLLPPFAFMFVSGLSFLIHPSKVANRLGLGTSMIISAVMFHISQTVNLPPMGRLILFDKIMLAVYAFLVSSLAVTALIAIDEDWWKDRDYTKQINAYGAVLTVLLPALLLVALIAF